MEEKQWLTERFEASRPHLRAVAYRMLGSLGEAEDAVQETWLRLNRAGTGIENPDGWLTTVTARICLDMLRGRRSRREEPLEGEAPASATRSAPKPDPEQEALLADSIGLAMLVVLQALAPAERVAFVLHDMFDLPFDEIAPIVDRSPEATRQLASRARRRVRGAAPASDPERSRNRAVVDAFLAAARSGDLQGLIAVLDPEAVFHRDVAAARLGGGPTGEARGGLAIANLFRGRAQGAQPILVDGDVGLLVAPGGRLRVVLRLTFKDGRIAAIEAVADPERLGRMELAVLSDRSTA